MAKIRKDKFDKFYTKDDIVDLCLSSIDLEKFNTVIEPAAGNGSFSNKIKNCIAIDIEPQGDGIIKQDYLNFNPFYFKIKRPVLVIGNPPFGNQSSLAIKFIRKSSAFADVIAFILPKSFRKRSMQDKLPLNFHLNYEIDLPDNSFYMNGSDYSVPSVFQIWEKSHVFRKKQRHLTPQTFSFVKKNENPDFSFRRVGVNAGTISREIEIKSEQSHYFIKSDELFFKKCMNLKWDHDNTAGPRSISKQELIRAIERKIIHELHSIR